MNIHCPFIFVVIMFKNFVNNIPNIKFWAASLVFWLILNTVASSHSYRMSIHYDRPAVFFDVWLEYLPWWGNWAIISPLIIAVTATISLERETLFKFIIKNIAVMLAIFTFYWTLTIIEVTFLKAGTLTYQELRDASNQLLLGPLHMDFIVYIAVFCGGYAYSNYKSSQHHAALNEQLEKQLIKVELQSLKSQLNPHFLFNTLNTIASLIRLEAKKNAIKALSELSLMMRKVLENESHQLIPIHQEINFIESYLTIQKMRFEDKLDIRLKIDDACLQIPIPFMLLQPLVENAIQHGSQLESNNYNLQLNAYIKHNRLVVKLMNKVPEIEGNKGFGIGLKNCRQRMEKLYNNDFELSLTKLENGYFETFLTLPLGNDND